MPLTHDKTEGGTLRFSDERPIEHAGPPMTSQTEAVRLPPHHESLDDKALSFIDGKKSFEVWPDRLAKVGRDVNVQMRSRAIHKSRLGLKALRGVFKSKAIGQDLARMLWGGRFEEIWRLIITVAQRPDVYADKIVSRKHRYVWLCNPKVGSRSLTAVLLGMDPTAEIIRGRSISDIYTIYPEVKNYYSFAFVRHPFSRALSFYMDIWGFREHYAGILLSRKEEKGQALFKRFFGLAQVRSFDDYCLWLNTRYGSDSFADRHFLSQHIQIRLECGRMPDFIGHFENLQADWHRLTTRLDIPTPTLIRLNTMAGWQATHEALKSVRAAAEAYLTERNKTLLRSRYAEDLELYKYSLK